MKGDALKTTIRLLKRGWLTHVESALLGGVNALSQRVGDLKKEGAPILDKWVTTKSGRRIKAYRWQR